MSYLQAILVLNGLMILSAVAFTVWCITTDERYMDTWRDEDELRGKR